MRRTPQKALFFAGLLSLSFGLATIVLPLLHNSTAQAGLSGPASPTEDRPVGRAPAPRPSAAPERVPDTPSPQNGDPGERLASGSILISQVFDHGIYIPLGVSIAAAVLGALGMAVSLRSRPSP